MVGVSSAVPDRFLPHAALDASRWVLIKVLVLCMWVEHIVFAQIAVL